MRHAQTYRAYRRNEAKLNGKLPEWRETAALRANMRAKLADRRTLAQGARTAVANALASMEAAQAQGLPTLGVPSAVAATTLFDYYRTAPRSRVVNRILRDLGRSQRAA